MSDSINPYATPQVELPDDQPPLLGSQGKKTKVVAAGKGPRFVNFLVDYAMLYAIDFAFAFALISVWGEQAYDFLESPAGVLIAIPCYLMYFVVLEASIGQTFGKLLTGTIVVNQLGEKPTFGQILGRNLARFIPFEPFSFLGQENRGWHDKLSKTFVVNKKRHYASNSSLAASYKSDL